MSEIFNFAHYMHMHQAYTFTARETGGEVTYTPLISCMVVIAWVT